MFSTYPKGKRKVPGAGNKGVKSESEELTSPLRARATITDSEEKRAEQVYGNYYGKKAPPPRREFDGVMVSPHKTMIGIG